MKQTHRLTNGLIGCAIALAMVASLAAQTAIDGSAKVIRVKGPARYTTGANVWHPVKPGDVLKPGTIVQTSTEHGSFVDLVLGDGGSGPVVAPVKFTPYIPNSMNSGPGSAASYQPSADQNVIRIWENTALGIDRLSVMQTGADEVSDIQLDLKAGHVTGNVRKLSPASKYEIKLPNGVAGIRGTGYDITADGVVRVIAGSVVVAWVNPKTGDVVTQVVSGGNQYDARTGQVTALGQTEVDTIGTAMGAMRVAGGLDQRTYAPDKTVRVVSPPRGPPFTPPGPPPIIPPGRGRGRP